VLAAALPLQPPQKQQVRLFFEKNGGKFGEMQ